MISPGILKKLWDMLGSRNLSVFVFVMGMTNILILFAFALLVPVWWVDNISTLLPYKALYVLFFVNLIICEIKWIPVVIRQCRKMGPPEREDEVKKFKYRVALNLQSSSINVFEKRLRRRGYSVWNMEERIPDVKAEGTSCSDSGASPLLYAARGRFSSIGNLLFHTSFLFILFGVIMSFLFRFQGSAMITEGFPFSGTRSEYKSASLAPLATFPKLTFDLETISAKFWEGRLFFIDLKSEMSYEGDVYSAWLSSPARINNANVTIAGYGYAPMYVLKDKGGRELDRGVVNLNIFIPGSEDQFELPDYPHQIFLSFYPDHEIKEGNIVNSSMNNVNPAYSIRIFRGRLPVYAGILKPGEEAKFDGLRLSFPSIYRWGDFTIVKDAGQPFIWTAFILMIAGIIWRLLFFNREVVIVRQRGTLYLCGKTSFYPALFLKRLELLAKIS